MGNECILCVGLNKFGLLRASRGKSRPRLTDVVRELAQVGCKSILVHQWSDNRHIRIEDIEEISAVEPVRSGEVKFNVGGDLREDLIDVIDRVGTVSRFVVTPFERAHLTTQRDWRSEDDQALLAATCQRLRGAAVVTVFCDPICKTIDLAADAGAGGVELNCRRYVENWGGRTGDEELATLAAASAQARARGLSVGIAHDLEPKHLNGALKAIRPDYVSMGHNFVVETLMRGLAPAFNSLNAELSA